LPNKVSGHKTPFEAFYGYQPNTDHLRVFGSRAFILVPPQKRKKLDNQAIEARIVGYIDGSKGWMFWIPAENRIKCSAWAQFSDDLLKLTAGKQEKTTEINPNLSKSAMQDIDPALLQARPQALRFVMAVQLGDFTDEVIVGQQEQLQDQLDQATNTPAPAPKKCKDILQHPNKESWLKAIKEELKNVYRHEIWTIELVLPGKRVMGARWVFVDKQTADGKLIKLKARYVAKGYARIAGVEFIDTFAPTATFVLLGLLLTVAAKCNWPVYSFDFVTAYLNSPIDEEVWVQPPEGLNIPKGHACKLKKALHGTKKAARCWCKHLQGKLKQLGYSPSQFDGSLYILKHLTHCSAIWVHFEDGVVTGSSYAILKQLEQYLKECL
jgi:hypothetical protein